MWAVKQSLWGRGLVRDKLNDVTVKKARIQERVPSLQEDQDASQNDQRLKV